MVKRNPPPRPWRVIREPEADPRQGYEMAKQYLGEDLWRRDDPPGHVDVGPFLRSNVRQVDGIDVIDIRFCHRDQHHDILETHNGITVPLDQLEAFAKLIQAAAKRHATRSE